MILAKEFFQINAFILPALIMQSGASGDRHFVTAGTGDPKDNIIQVMRFMIFRKPVSWSNVIDG
jgi:hypothetical protein